MPHHHFAPKTPLISKAYFPKSHGLGSRTPPCGWTHQNEGRQVGRKRAA